jgi:hypothetical protein
VCEKEREGMRDNKSERERMRAKQRKCSAIIHSGSVEGSAESDSPTDGVSSEGRAFSANN